LELREMRGNNARDTVIVVDASISMETTDWLPSRIDAAKDAAHAYCRRLAVEEPGARVGIVAYGSRAKCMCPLTPVTDLDRIAKRIDSIRILGNTNITAGLKQATVLLKAAREARQIIVLSDGYHNRGPDPRSVARDLRYSSIVECIGIGGTPMDVDRQLMEDISSFRPDGSKRYRWIGDRGALVEEFRRLAGRITR